MFVHAIHLSKSKLFFWLIQITVFDLLFMWLGLKFYFYKSFAMFLNSSKNIIDSRKKMNELIAEQQYGISIEEVITKMNKMLAGQTIIKGRN
jgi:hypothetical protein